MLFHAMLFQVIWFDRQCRLKGLWLIVCCQLGAVVNVLEVLLLKKTYLGNLDYIIRCLDTILISDC